jgi:hypothetical protein
MGKEAFLVPLQLLSLRFLETHWKHTLKSLMIIKILQGFLSASQNFTDDYSEKRKSF